MSSAQTRLRKLFKAMSGMESEMSLPLLNTLLAVAVTPGISVNDLAELIRVPQQTASRYVSILQGRYQTLGSTENIFMETPLLEIGISMDDPRKRAVELTAHGKARVEQLLKDIYEGH